MTTDEAELNLTDLVASCARIVALDAGNDILEIATLSADDPRNVELVMDAIAVLNKFVGAIPKGTASRPN